MLENTTKKSVFFHRIPQDEKPQIKSPNNFKLIFQKYLLIPVITLAIYFISKNQYTSSFRLQFTLLSLIALLVFGYSLRKKGIPYIQNVKFNYLLTVVILFLIASTGWFFSPFFFVLYLWPIFLAFIFSPQVSLGFVITLVMLFSFNIGEVDLAYDFMIVLSLLTTIPLSLYLRKEYLRLKESEKEILVLRKQKDNFTSTIEDVLANKISNVAVNLRQPINDINQLAFRMKDVKEKQQLEKDREEILASSIEALRLLKEFEEQTTGKKLKINPETS